MSKIYEDFLPAPIAGMKDNVSILNGDKNYALYLQNFICRPYGLQLHKAGELFLSPPVDSKMLFTYSKPDGTDQLWLANNSGLYNISGATYPAASIVITNGEGQAVPMNTGAGSYLFFFNGTDTAKIYDGTTWAAASITGLTTSGLRAGCVYRKRLYMLENGKLGFWYLSPSGIAGSAVYYDAGTIFTRGGYAVSIQPYTRDGGIGQDDFLAVLSSNGELALFSGNDPAASSWIPMGTYFVGQPPGDSPFQMVRYGGDLLILTGTGVYSVTALTSGKSLPFDGGISKNITQFMSLNVAAYPKAKLFVLPSVQLLYVYLRQGLSLAMDLQTGGWSTMPGISSGEGSQPADSTFWVEFDNGNGYEVLSISQKNVYIGWRNLNGTYWSVTHPYLRFSTLHDKQQLQIRPYIQAIGTATGIALNYLSAKNSSGQWVMNALPVQANFWAPTISNTLVSGLIFQHWITPQTSPGFNISYSFNGTLPGSNTLTDLIYLGSDLRSASAGIGGP